MKLTENIIDNFCKRVFHRLKSENELVLKVDEKDVLAAMKESINREMKRKEDVIKEAEKVLAQYEGQMGDKIDRGKMLSMIKGKLFKERNIVL
jgi:hypothetical protein